MRMPMSMLKFAIKCPVSVSEIIYTRELTEFLALRSIHIYLVHLAVIGHRT